MSHNLKARFTLPVKMIQHILDDDAKRASYKYNLKIESNGGVTSVSGPAQEVMFLIGAVASHGQDELSSVVPAGADINLEQVEYRERSTLPRAA